MLYCRSCDSRKVDHVIVVISEYDTLWGIVLQTVKRNNERTNGSHINYILIQM